jgi:hypothetical protein
MGNVRRATEQETSTPRTGWKKKANGRVYYVGSNGRFSWLEGDPACAIEAEADLVRLLKELEGYRAQIRAKAEATN